MMDLTKDPREMALDELLEYDKLAGEALKEHVESAVAIIWGRRHIATLIRKQQQKFRDPG